MIPRRFSPKQTANPITSGIACVSLLLWIGCAGTKKNPNAPDLVALEGQKIAIVEIKGESSAQKIIEVALINQILKHGTFILVSKQEMEEAKAAPEQDPMDLEGAAYRAGAQYTIRVETKRFETKRTKGYSREKVYDSKLAEERGEKEGHTEQLYQVERLVGQVEFVIHFIGLNDPSHPTHQWETVSTTRTLEQDNRKGAIHFPPVLRFLEELSNEAFSKFFEKKS